MEKREGLERIAESIADSTPVDWNAATESTPELARTLRRLHTIERIAAAHRSSLSDAAPKPLLTWGHLRAIEKLGEGSYGAVYRAIDTILDREVALKLRTALPAQRAAGAHEASGAPGAAGMSDGRDAAFQAAAARRYLDEARRLARVRHPNVLRVHGADTHDGVVGLWCDLVRGRTLEERLAAEGPLGADEAALVGRDLCRALAAVHAAGLVHGDVKAANVMREEGGAIILLDFGSGHDLAADPSMALASGLTATPITLAPEALRGGPASPATDLYALGVLLYRLVSGAYPIPAATIDELRAKHARGESVPLCDRRPDLPAAFVQIVERALSPEPAARFASAGEMERALAASEAPASSAAARDPGARSRRRAFTLLAGAAAVVALFLLARGQRAPRDGGASQRAGAAGEAITATEAAAPLRVEARLYRSDEQGAAPLETGSAVSPGDQLFLEVEADAPFHAYVLDEDLEGNLFVLFPVEGLELANPLAANRRHRLPGFLDGAPHDWQVTSAGGRETILVVTSREPLEPLERRLASIPAVETGALAYAELDPAALAGLRGIAGIAPSRAAMAKSGSRLAEIAREFRALGARGAGIWLREFELSNP